MKYTIENDMKTFNGAELVMHNYAKQIAKYPANSLSKREIVSTISINDVDEKKFSSIDTKLTKLLYDEAVVAIDKNKGAFKVTPSEWLTALTNKVRQTVET